MHVVTNRVYVTPKWAEEFEQRFKRRAGQIEQQPWLKPWLHRGSVFFLTLNFMIFRIRWPAPAQLLASWVSGWLTFMLRVGQR